MCGIAGDLQLMKASGLDYVETNVSDFLIPEKTEQEILSGGKVFEPFA